MTPDDVIRMAAACGIPEFENHESQADNIIRFATLVAAAERKRIISANAPEIERINEYIKVLEDAFAAEREACARMVEPVDESLADEIRLRGEK